MSGLNFPTTQQDPARHAAALTGAPPPLGPWSGPLTPDVIAYMKRQREVQSEMTGQPVPEPPAPPYAPGLRDHFVSPGQYSGQHPGQQPAQTAPPNPLNHGAPPPYQSSVPVQYAPIPPAPSSSTAFDYDVVTPLLDPLKQQIHDLRNDVDAIRDYLTAPPEALGEIPVAFHLDRVGTFESVIHGLVVEAEYAVLVFRTDSQTHRRFVPEPGSTFEFKTLDGKFHAMLSPHGLDFEFGGLHFMPMKRLEADDAMPAGPSPAAMSEAALAVEAGLAAQLDGDALIGPGAPKLQVE
jgi:hypothetical protein